ncbi:MAG: putative DNA binding domain-containing protein [Muribaculaceae bacterium]|nr:putative DNA binding domain-containing protein [Muribaculaceae bacterium]
MITIDEVRLLLSDIESDRIERTVSTTNTDKFGQAICAFANDLPNHNLPGYLIIGADDKTGKINSDVRITDQLLQNLGGIKTDGKLQPQVSMTVEKVAMPEGDVAVVTVQPCQFTPVRYEGRIWIRNGPRKCIASEADEKLLLEKRTSRMLTFDALPCFDATLDDIDLAAFRQIYLPKAFPEEVLSANASEEPKKEPRKEPKKEPRKEPKKELKKELAEVLNLIKENPKITYQELMAELGIKDSAIYERIRKLKEVGRLRREGGRSGGIWVVIN